MCDRIEVFQVRIWEQLKRMKCVDETSSEVILTSIKEDNDFSIQKRKLDRTYVSTKNINYCSWGYSGGGDEQKKEEAEGGWRNRIKD